MEKALLSHSSWSGQQGFGRVSRESQDRILSGGDGGKIGTVDVKEARETTCFGEGCDRIASFRARGRKTSAGS